ncbi:MAG: PGF-pre-PGF domain-containing protein, partial [Thermoplasmatales archaeon]|nr:PGF-pre-PGF domain-containing protein [Thermoplasmatales archaeon]
VLILLMSFSMIFIATIGAKESLPKISDGDGDAKLPGVDDPVVKDPVVKDPVVDDPVVKAEDNIKIKIETVLGNISKGKKTEVISENYKETDVYSVSFTPSIDLKKVKLTVVKLKDKPEEIIEIPIKNNSVYAYLDIKLTADDVYIEEDGLESMKFIFEVKLSWINENNIDKRTIFLVRYHDTEWQNLTTTCLGENDTYVYYEAETPGLSTFAVVGSELIESSASYVEEAPEVPWILNMGIIASSSTMLFVVLFKARYIYLDEEDDTKGSKKRLSRKFR